MMALLIVLGMVRQRKDADVIEVGISYRSDGNRIRRRIYKTRLVYQYISGERKCMPVSLYYNGLCTNSGLFCFLVEKAADCSVIHDLLGSV